MEGADKFNLSNFQKQVFDNYKVVARQFTLEKNFQNNDGFETDLVNKRFSIRRVFTRLQKYFNGLYFKMPDFVEREKETLMIISQVEIRRLLCPLLSKIPSYGSETDVIIETIKVITEVLTASSARNEIVIAKDPQLFSLIVYKILDQGVDSFCSSDKAHL